MLCQRPPRLMLDAEFLHPSVEFVLLPEQMGFHLVDCGYDPVERGDICHTLGCVRCRFRERCGFPEHVPGFVHERIFLRHGDRYGLGIGRPGPFHGIQREQVGGQIMTENRFNGAINRYNYVLTLADMTVTSSKRNGNLTFNDILYLNMIRYIPDCTASKIADAAHVAKSSVTVKINSLCDRGLVVRKRSEDDGRVWYLGLSPVWRRPSSWRMPCCPMPLLF